MKQVLRRFWTARWRKIWLRLAIMLVSAVILTYFLEYRYFLNNGERAWDFVMNSPRVFWYSSLLMFFIVLLFSGIFKKPFTGPFVTLALIIIVTYIHINKFILRGTPLLPEDFQLASEAASMTKFVNWGSLIRMLMAVGIALGLGVLCNHLTRRVFERKEEPKSWARKHMVAERIFMITVACLGFMLGTDFARNHSGQRYEDIPWLKTQFVAWNQERNYDWNGFILGFCYNWSKFNLTAPDGYDEGKIQTIYEKYAKRAAADEGRTSLAEKDYNIVVILNESFYDPEIIAKYYPYSGGEVTPVLNRIKKTFPYGQMYSTDYGGGTANIEFEVLTGLTNYWANTVPYTDLIPRSGVVPSIAWFTADFGYETVAVHPFNGGMYKRNLALKNEGFETFITETEMKHTEHDGQSQYINDRSTYQETLDVIKDSEEKVMVGVITMQNHTPYDPWIYDDYKFTVENADDGARGNVETYLQMLHNSDAYLGEFLEKLGELSEDTVVLFFGDHSPGIFPLVNDAEEKEVRDLARLTPYFIWANFGLAPESLPTTTPNCLVNTMYNLLNVKKPVLGYLLDEICTETPILTPAYFDDEAPFQSTELSEYELVNYDILGGEKYWVKLSGD